MSEQPPIIHDRMIRRHEILPEYGPVMIPAICMSIRIACNGSSDPCSEVEKACDIAFLRCCLDTWQLPENRVDEAVRELIEATLAEVSGDRQAGGD